MDAVRLAADTKEPIGRVGGGFMISREVKAIGDEFGLMGHETYFRGRCGVLGEVDADVVTAACVFMPAAYVRECWEKGRKISVETAVERYAAACHAWSHRKLGSFTSAARLCELLEAVAHNADGAGATLFAGWRAVPLPSDPISRMGQLLHVVRELRGGLHAIAVLAGGQSPLMATLAGGTTALSASPIAVAVSDGETAARFFSWPEPYPEPGQGDLGRRARAEELTDELMAGPLSVLSDAEAAEFTTLLDGVLATASG